MVVPRDDSQAIKAVAENPEHITLIQTIWANGDSEKPSVILPKLKNLPSNIPDYLFELLNFSGSTKGWINSIIFSLYMEKIFIPG